MFDSNSSFQQLDSGSILSAPEPLDIGSILLLSNLPKEVKTARIAYTNERLINETEISRLTEPTLLEKDDPKYIERLRNRRKALSAYLGSSLVCVLIRYPGVCYTIEIDPIYHSVVHWEWQLV